MSLEKMALNILSRQIPGMRHGEFTKSVLRQIRLWGETDAEDLADEMHRNMLRPDAYSFCNYCQCIHVFEIEDTSMLNEERLIKYLNVFHALDFIEIGLVLWIVDRYGQIVRHLDLVQVMAGLIASGQYDGTA